MKYIIKNCPAYKKEDDCEYDCFLNHKSGFVEICQNVDNCLLKKIVEECKKVDCDCLINKRKCGAIDNMPMCCELFAKKDILRLLEIEEVE